MSSRNVYIVDDDDAARTALHSLLSIQSNLIVRSFRSGDAFLADCETLDAGVALLDHDMPRPSGLDLLVTLKQRQLPICCLILSAHGSIPLAVRAVKAGAHDFLEKPCDPGLLLASIEEAFKRVEALAAPDQRKAEAIAKIAKLSGREQDVLAGLIEGRSNKAIALGLTISTRTVEVYRANLMDKLEVKSLPDAMRIAFAAGIVSLD